MFEKDFEGELKDCDNAITFLTVCLIVFVAGIFLFNVIADGNISVILFALSVFIFLYRMILKKEKEKLIERKRLEQEKIKKEYEIKKQRKKKKYIEFIIENSKFFYLYKEIMQKGKEYCGYNKEKFKILFWDFLLEDKKSEFEVWKSNLLSSNKEVLKNIPIYNEQTMIISGFHDTNYLEILTDYFRGYKLKKCFRSELRKDYYFEACAIIEAYGYAKLFRFFMDFYKKKVRQFEKNEELMKMYNVLNNEKCDTKYIQKTIYNIYEALYDNDKVKKMSQEDVNLIIKLKQIDYERENNNKEVCAIKSKEQVIEFICKKYNRLSENQITDIIVNSLKDQSNINADVKSDMVQNIDDVLNEIMSKIREKKQKERAIQMRIKKERERKQKVEKAEKERDRLLNGDFSKERKKSEV